MKVINPSFTIEPRDEQRGGMAIIERAGRICYKSEDKVTDNSAEAFVTGLIRRSHLAMLEHGDIIFYCDDYHILDNVADALRFIRYTTGKAPMLNMTFVNRRPIISGNVRAWRELLMSNSTAALYFTGKIDRIYTADILCDAEIIDDPRIRQIRYADLTDGIEQQAHRRMSVRFIVDRGVSHEFVRHRVMSFAQESTRYCNYSQDRFDNEVTVIAPCYLLPGTEPYITWENACKDAEKHYFEMLDLGLQAQEARAVLPHSVKTELMMTGTLAHWQHFFDLRARQLTGKAHPQAVEVALPLYKQVAALYPAAIC